MRTDPPASAPAAGRLTRRTALAGLGAVGALLAVAGCTRHQIAPTGKLVGDDPLGPLYSETTALVTAYDQAMATTPGLVPLVGQLREETRRHAVALAALIGLAAPAISPGPAPSGTLVTPTPTPSPSAGPPGPKPSPPGSPSPSASPVDPTAAARATLSAAEKSAQLSTVAAVVGAAADRVAVLASIAAGRATHVAALR